MRKQEQLSDTLTLNEVADELGVHYMTAYRYVRLGMLHATQEGRSWVIRRDDLEAFNNAGPAATARGEARWDERLLSRMLDADGSGAWAVVEAALASGTSVPDAYTKLLAPVLRSVGDLWAAGEISVAEEHVATDIASRIVARLGPRMTRRGVRKGTVVLGSTQTERHSLPTSMAADLVRQAGFHVINLDVNLPAESFAGAVATADDPLAAVISVTMNGQEVELSATIAAIRDLADIDVIVGGSGIERSGALAAGASHYAASAEELIDLLEANRMRPSTSTEAP
jgi:excisionase family DNA binding protein